MLPYIPVNIFSVMDGWFPVFLDWKQHRVSTSSESLTSRPNALATEPLHSAKRQAWSGSELFDTLMVFLKEFLERSWFWKKISRWQKSLKNYPGCKELSKNVYSYQNILLFYHPKFRNIEHEITATLQLYLHVLGHHNTAKKVILFK